MSKESLSVIIPFYNEMESIEKNIGIICEHLENLVSRKLLETYRLVLVNDGSTDGTWNLIKKFAMNNETVKAINLSRNFGKEAALCAGLEHAEGNASIIMDSDLQHPPELLEQMVDLWKNKGFEVIEAVKSNRGEESIFKKTGSEIFYNIFSKLTGIRLKNASDYRLLDEKAIAAWRNMPERLTFFRGMSSWIGFNRMEISFDVKERSGGSTKWSPFKLFKLATSAITSFSTMPLHLVTITGIIFLFASIVLGIQTLLKKLSGAALSGFTTVILLLLITGSMLMLSLGIIGTYIAKIYEEIKNRPRYLITEIFDGKQLPEP